MKLARLKAVLSYNPDSGLFTWKKRLSNRTAVGNIAGAKATNGYIYISIDNKDYLAHRLAWLYQYGHMPTDQLDHLNGKRDDNRIVNLREASNFENNLNRHKPRKDNTSGHTGIHFDKGRQRWLVLLGNKFIGRYDTLDEALAARRSAARKTYAKSKFWKG